MADQTARLRRLLRWAPLAATAACGVAPATIPPGQVVGAAPIADAGDDAGPPPVLTPATIRALQALSPASLPGPPPDVSNTHADDQAAAAFGQQLFFDTGFSGALLDSDNIGDAHSLGTVGQTGKVSCSKCHVPNTGFLDTRSVRQTVSLASGWGRRRAPSLLDVGQAKLIMWDGRHDALYNQPFGALENGVEMNSSRLYAAEQIYKRYRATYEAVFGPIPVPLDDPSRFPQLDGTTTGCRQLSTDVHGISVGVNCHGVPGDAAEFDGLQTQQDRDEVTRVWVNAGKAIGAYERLLTCGSGRFDQWMHGQQGALTPSEQRGAALFVGQREDGSTMVGCDSCHSGPFLTDEGFHNVGMQPTGVGPAGTFLDIPDDGELDGLTQALSDPLNVRGAFSDGDDGRLPQTVPPGANGAFRTPSLRCVALRPTFMHTGQLRTLANVITFFDNGGSPSGFPGTSEISPLNLTAQERADLVAFLLTLTGPGANAALQQMPPLP